MTGHTEPGPGITQRAHPVAGGSQFKAVQDIQRVNPPKAPEKQGGTTHASP